MRVRQIARALADVGELRLVIAGGEEDFPMGSEREETEFQIDRFLPLRDVTPGNLATRFQRAFEVQANPYGREVDEEGRRWLGAHLSQFDLLWLHHLRTAYAFDRWRWPRSVMDVDDVSSTHSRSVALNSEQLGERLKSHLHVHLARRRERLLSDRFVVVSVCSEADRDYLKLPGPVHVIPNGFELPTREPIRNVAVPPRIGFIGTFNYQANVDSVHWFMRDCWPRIKQQIPDVRLRLAGSNSFGLLKPQGPDIDVLGYLEKPDDEIATWSIMIVPTRKGAGTRVKIADGLSKKVPVVATSLGVCGYAVKSGVELYISDGAEDFAAACVKAVKDPEASRQMAERGWDRFTREWSWDAIRPKIWAAAEDCLHQSRSSTPERSLAGV